MLTLMTRKLLNLKAVGFIYMSCQMEHTPQQVWLQFISSELKGSHG